MNPVPNDSDPTECNEFEAWEKRLDGYGKDLKKRTSQVTGQVFLRDAGKDAPKRPGKKLMMVIGVIAIDEATPLKTENQYTIVGEHCERGLGLAILGDSGAERTDVVGYDADQILLHEMWRV